MVKYLFLSLFLCGCSNLPQFPEVRPKFVSSKLNVFQCEFDGTGDLQCNTERSSPINTVGKHYCVSIEEVQAMRRWVKEVQRDYTCKRK